MTESWKPSPIRGDMYQVSDSGRVRRVFSDGSTRICKQSLSRTGNYPVVVLVDVTVAVVLAACVYLLIAKAL